MAKPLSRIKKVRSLDEIITRGGQAISAYRDQRGGIELPSDESFAKLIDETQFGSAPIIAESLWQAFFKNGSERFFPSLQDRDTSVSAFRATFDDGVAERFIAAADNIVDGRIDLLGLKGLYVGKDIDWLREPLSAKRSPLKHWKEFDDFDTESGNKKIVWELNRHQHFFTLGVAFWLTSDEKYGEAFARHLSSWIEQNPPGLGVNWSSSLEIALRSMSWIWGFHLFRDSDHLTPKLFLDALKHLHRHGRHIERYLSKYYSPNTHLTGEGLGLYYLGTQLPFFKRAERWRRLGEDILTGEIEKQILPDGVYFEQSLWYQRYSVDFYVHFAILRSLFGGPCLNTDAARIENRLQAAFDWMMAATQPDGSTPLIGDDDGGRMLPLTSARSDDFRASLAVSAIIFDRADHKFVSGGINEDIFWLTGIEGLAAYDRLNAAEPALNSAEFKDGGYCVMRDGWRDADNYLIVDAGEVGALSGGHGHADALSIVASINGQPLLVDSGTYTYHESRELRDYFRSTSAHNTL
ncbi:MAG: alginate lyase family protein, partial [Pyrinomonadaceae bacterium]|nr:alginate lyase family protein [Pyrinomonadaceae bacterium]